MIWSYLVHIGFNMWREENGPVRAEYTNASKKMRFDKELWEEILTFAKSHGVNTIVMDLGEGIRYESHPEIAAEGAWPVQELKAEIRKMKDMGITPVPKLNFSTAHDEWLGEYSRMVSSKPYYDVCRDLINEVCGIFDNPPYFHLGMDEEKESHVPFWGYYVVRHGDFWWNDLYFYINELEKNNVRPWIWSDNIWEHRDEFIKKMPKTVLQSNWYYGDYYDRSEIERFVSAYETLDREGFEQIPCGMNLNIIRTVKHCMDTIAPDRLKGFLQTSWAPTLMTRKYTHYAAMDYLGQARSGFEGNETMFAGWKGIKESFASYTQRDTLDFQV